MKLDKKKKVIWCGCGESFPVAIHNLTEPVDAYAEYVDAYYAKAGDKSDGSKIFDDPGFLEFD